jgi:MoxR-like ATPase
LRTIKSPQRDFFANHSLFKKKIMKFHGTQNYVATGDLMLSINAAITLQRPLLVTGETGTVKTMLAEEVVTALNVPL